MNSTDPVVLVIGGGARQYRGYLLSSAATRHALWSFDAAEPSWQRELLAGWTVVDALDADAVLAAAIRLADSRPVAGVLSWDEALVENTARVADALGLPGATARGARNCRDKHSTRAVLTAAGVAQPAYGFADTEPDAVRIAERIGHPVVVKPRGMGASIGVVLARNGPEVRSAFRDADGVSRQGAAPFRGGALVEEYLTGEEISVDAAVVDGEYLPMFLARKHVGMFPHFEELGHTVDPADALLADADLMHMLATAHRALGLRFGITHTEVKLTPRGPVIVEVNGRLGGDLIPYVGRLATGVDPGVAMVDVATGRHPDLTPARARVVGVRFGYPPQDCVVRSVSVPTATPGLLSAVPLVEPGTTLRLPPGGYIARHSYVICTAGSAAECATRLEASISQVHLTWRTAPPPDGAIATTCTNLVAQPAR